MKPVEKKHIRIRIFALGVLFSVLLAVIGAKAIYLQIYCKTWLAQKAADQYEKSCVIRGKRGTIYDVNQRVMAVSTDMTSIAAYPARINDPDQTARSLGRILGISHRDLKEKLTARRSFVWIKRQVTPKEKSAVEALTLEGIDFVPEHSRFYPNKTLAGQVLGFSGIDGHGLEGIEFYYDTYLKGEEITLTVLKDALGRDFEAENGKALDTSGNDLVLTIDRTIQYITESALQAAVREFSAVSGMAVVMVPKTGAILALAHVPVFNPNSFRNFSSGQWRNRALTDPFEPGSTMKIFNAAAAIESGAIGPNTIFFCENGSYRIGRNVVHDTHSHGWLSLQQIVKYSSNIGSVKVIEQIGPQTLHKTLQAFGFGSKTGIDCPGETSGNLLPHQHWSRIDAGAISFGQGISVSAVQLITAVSAIANDGIRMKPYLVQAIMDPNGRMLKSFGSQEGQRVISAKTARSIKNIMKTVITQGGTGVNAALEGYSVCGKTGTAQKIDATGGYAKGKYNASFVGFAPAENPQIAILVVVDEPEKEHYGGIVAAPAFKKIAHETLSYLQIRPGKVSGDEQLKKLTVEFRKGVSG